jgi:hypothetical protein
MIETFEGLRILAQRAPWSPDVELLVVGIDERGVRRCHATNVIMQNYTPENENLVREPTLRLTQEAAQLLMDQLWSAGLRPSEGSGSAGALAATERHLADMRELAMGFARNSIRLNDSVSLDIRPST